MEGKDIIRFDCPKYPTCPAQLTIDPYEGCSHRCIYCIALFGEESTCDEERVRSGIVEAVDRELGKRNREGKPKIPIYLSPWTDAYQPLEAKEMVTREIIKTIIKHGYPFFIITKSDLVTRDMDLLTEEGVRCNVCFSIVTPDDETRKMLEPGATSIDDRFKAIKELSRNGVRTIVKLDPVIPSITDDEGNIREIIRRSFDAGASHITAEVLRLTPSLWKHIQSRGWSSEAVGVLRRTYIEEGFEKNGSIYIPKDRKDEILRMIFGICQEFGLPFTTCRQTTNLKFSDGVCTGVNF